jgi:hypothetical protein
VSDDLNFDVLELYYNVVNTKHVIEKDLYLVSPYKVLYKVIKEKSLQVLSLQARR